MKKILIILFCLCLLTGCTNNNLWFATPNLEKYDLTQQTIDTSIQTQFHLDDYKKEIGKTIYEQDGYYIQISNIIPSEDDYEVYLKFVGKNNKQIKSIRSLEKFNLTTQTYSLAVKPIIIVSADNKKFESEEHWNSFSNISNGFEYSYFIFNSDDKKELLLNPQNVVVTIKLNKLIEQTWLIKE